MATLVFDNNYLHCYKSSFIEFEELDSPRDDGSTHSLSVTLDNKKPSDILKTGNLLMFDIDGNIEKIPYTDRESTPNGFNFYTSTTLTKVYEVGSEVGVPESFYAHGGAQRGQFQYSIWTIFF